MNRRLLVCCCAATVFLAGCGPDLGLEGNIPIADATDLPPHPLVVEAVLARPDHRPEAFELGHRTWLASERPFPAPFPQSLLAPIGSAGDRTVLALAWDDAPYDRLYIRQDGRTLQQFLPLRVSAPAREAGTDMGDDPAH